MCGNQFEFEMVNMCGAMDLKCGSEYILIQWTMLTFKHISFARNPNLSFERCAQISHLWVHSQTISAILFHVLKATPFQYT